MGKGVCVGEGHGVESGESGLLGFGVSLSRWEIPTDKVKLSVKVNIACPVRGRNSRRMGGLPIEETPRTDMSRRVGELSGVINRTGGLWYEL